MIGRKKPRRWGSVIFHKDRGYIGPFDSLAQAASFISKYPVALEGAQLITIETATSIEPHLKSLHSASVTRITP